MKINIPSLISRKTLLILGVALMATLGLGAYFALHRPPRVDMTRYVPANSLAFVEAYNLGDLVDGITSTRTWREMAPVLGLSSQLKEIGPLFGLFGRTGIGPDEAVIAGRAQFACAITSLEADAGSTDEGPFVHLKPHFVLVIETHSNRAVAERVVRDKVGIVARRLFGELAVHDVDSYQGIEVHTFHGSDQTRPMLGASTAGLVLIANDRTALESCVDAISGRVQNMADDPVLARFRPTVDHNSSMFGYLTAAGIDKLSAIGPAILSSRFTTDPERMSSVASLFRHISSQALSGLLYGGEFTEDGVTERYLTVLSPYIASAMTETFKPSAGLDEGCLRFVPRWAEDFTVVNAGELGGLPERALKRISPGLDVVGGLALREFVLGFYGQLGTSSPDLIKKGLGDQMVLVKFSEPELGVIAQIRDRQSLAAYVQSYLGNRGARVWTENYKGIEISMSSAEDERAAALDGTYLLTGRAARVRQMIDAKMGNKSGEENRAGSQVLCDARFTSVGDDARLLQALSGSSGRAPVISCSPCPRDAATLMLEISRLTRTTDGSREILERDEARRALERLPPSVTFTEFRDTGVYTETRSAIGNLSLIVSLGSED